MSVRLSIVVPVYNEGGTVRRVVKELLNVAYPCPTEVIVVDDGSDDQTAIELLALEDQRVLVHRHPRNLGKGAALMSGIALASGTHLLPFDADLEYRPGEIPLLLQPLLEGRAKVVYGTRLFGVNTVYQSLRYAVGNKMTTLAANLLFDSWISDLHTCLKLVPLEVVRELDLRETGFGLDTELTASLLKAGYRPFEVPISYHSRSRGEGKKITWRDGVSCLRILAQVRFTARYAKTAPPQISPLLHRLADLAGAGSRDGNVTLLDHALREERAASAVRGRPELSG